MINLKGVTVDRVHVGRSPSGESKVVMRIVDESSNKYKVFAIMQREDVESLKLANKFSANQVTEVPWIAGRTARRHWKSLVEDIPQKALS